MRQLNAIQPLKGKGTVPEADNLLVFLICTYALVLVLGVFVLRGTIGINLGDEGYAWYGAQRTLLGEVPLRDFQSYEPGRYYWVAGCMKLLGSNGLYAFRIAVTLFQAIGVCVALLLVYEGSRSKFNVLLGGPILLLWMITPFRSFEDTLSILLVGATFLVLDNLNVKRAFLSGAVLGLVALFGKNHALYGLLALAVALGLSAFTHRKKLLPNLVSFGAGVFVGSLPLIGLIVFESGFFGAFIDSVMLLIHIKGTNLPLPIPLPWKLNFSDYTWWVIARYISLTVFFILLPLFGLVGALLVSFRGRSLILQAPVFVAAILVSIPYTHYAFSRADPEHLSSSIHAFLIGVLTIPLTVGYLYRIAITSCLGVVSWLGIRNCNPYFMPTTDWVKYKIGNHQYLISKENLSYLETFRRAKELAGPGGRLFIAPHWPAAYPIVGQKTQTWQSFFLVSWPEHVQQAELKRFITDPPKVAVIREYPLDGKPGTYFSDANPLIWKYLSDNYYIYPMEDLPSDVKIFLAKDRM